MLPDPLHPAVVHFPIVLTFLLPLVALGALWHARRNPGSRGAWMLTVALAGALTASAWMAVETGEGDEEGAEQVVPDAALESHEEAAERFLLLSAGILLVIYFNVQISAWINDWQGSFFNLLQQALALDWRPPPAPSGWSWREHSWATPAVSWFIGTAQRRPMLREILVAVQRERSSWGVPRGSRRMTEARPLTRSC